MDMRGVKTVYYTGCAGATFGYLEIDHRPGCLVMNIFPLNSRDRCSFRLPRSLHPFYPQFQPFGSKVVRSSE